MLHHHKLSHLRYEEFFGLFPSYIRSKFLNECTTRTHKAGDVLFGTGDQGDWMGAILAGRVRISIPSVDGKEMLLSMFESGEIFGERAVLDGNPRAANAIAERETTFLLIKKEQIMPLLFQYPEAMFCVVQILCNRLLRYTETMHLYALGNLPIRLASVLLSLAHTYGEEKDGHLIIRSGLTQTDLSQKLGSSRESVNRQMKTFVDAGLIEMHDHSIIILDRQGLEEICQPGVES